MRQKRAKVYRKLLASYIRHFGLRPPLQILIDAPMALTLAGMKLSSEEVPQRLASVLQVTSALPSGYKSGPSSSAASLVKPMITQCSINELYKVQKEGERESRAVELAKQWERRYCNHKEAIPGDRCVCEVIGDRNKHRYVLASESAGLRNKIRLEVIGVPVVHTNNTNVLVMEPMSELTRKRCDEMERKKLKLPAAKEGEVLGKRKAEAGEGDGSAEVESEAKLASIPRKKRAKGPNPLSVQKPKRSKEPVKSEAAKKKDKRRRKRQGVGPEAPSIST